MREGATSSFSSPPHTHKHAFKDRTCHSHDPDSLSIPKFFSWLEDTHARSDLMNDRTDTAKRPSNPSFSICIYCNSSATPPRSRFRALGNVSPPTIPLPIRFPQRLRFLQTESFPVVNKWRPLINFCCTLNAAAKCSVQPPRLHNDEDGPRPRTASPGQPRDQCARDPVRRSGCPRDWGSC